MTVSKPPYAFIQERLLRTHELPSTSFEILHGIILILDLPVENCFEHIADNLPYVDTTNAVALGASYGGYMISTPTHSFSPFPILPTPSRP